MYRRYETHQAHQTCQTRTLGEDYGVAVYWLPWAWLSGAGAGITYMLNWYA